MTDPTPDHVYFLDDDAFHHIGRADEIGDEA